MNRCTVSGQNDLFGSCPLRLQSHLDVIAQSAQRFALSCAALRQDTIAARGLAGRREPAKGVSSNALLGLDHGLLNKRAM
jgi:hypothetical protein